MKKKTQRRLWLRFDRVLSQNFFKQLAVLGVAFLAVLAFSYLLLALSGSDWLDFCHAHNLSPWLLPLYLLIDTNALNNLYIDNGVHGWMLFASTISFLLGAFIFNGIIIGLITTSIDSRVKDHREGRIHYLLSGHYIIMGYDNIVSSFITHIFDKDPDAYVLLLSSKSAEEIREKMRKSFTQQQLKHIIINYGHRITTDTYPDIHLDTAEQIYIVGNHEKSTHDAINVECVDSICRYLSQPAISQRPTRITCVFKDLDTYTTFKTTDIFQKVNTLGIEFVPYNVYAGWAKQVFVKRTYLDIDNNKKEYPYPSIYGPGITPDDPHYVHLVFVGTTHFAVAFAMEAAQVLHFPNYQHKSRAIDLQNTARRTRITFIDINADKEKDEFIIRNRHLFEVQPYLYRDLSTSAPDSATPNPVRTEFLQFHGTDNSNFLDIEFEFIKGDVFSQPIQDEITRWANDKKGQYLSIFLALANQRSNFVLSMNMPDKIYHNEIPVFIRQDRSDNFVTNLRTTDQRTDSQKLPYTTIKNGHPHTERHQARYANIYPFGMEETAYSADEHSLQRAKLINYLYATANYTTYRFTGILTLQTIPTQQIWTRANAEWKKLSVALKWSNLYSAYAMRTKLATLRAMRHLQPTDTSHDFDTLTDDEVQTLSTVEHNRWNVEKLLMGYRKPQPHEDKHENPTHATQLQRNKNLYIHHDIRPFDLLGAIQELDREFTRYIPWIMQMTEKK